MSTFEHKLSDDTVKDYAHKIAILVDLTEMKLNKMEFGVLNLMPLAHGEEQQTRMITLLKRHVQIIFQAEMLYHPLLIE